MVGASLVGKEEGGEGGGHGGSLFDQLIYLLLLISALQFEVHKREGLGTDLGNILSITIPRELRGRSEVVVFISDKPVRGKVRMLQGVGRDWHSFIIVLNEFLLQTFPPPPPFLVEVDSLSAIPKPPLLANQQQKTLPLWEEKLVAAQNILFNQELFFQVRLD